MSLDNYQTASFRGISFLIGDLDTSGGRKKITHEYPNSDRRTHEDLGLLDKIFNIRGLVKTDQDFTAKDRLIDALEQEGSGELVHPTFGTVNVSALPYTVSERTREVGIARFVMIFEVTQTPVFPRQTSVKPSLIKSQSDIVIGGVTIDIEDVFEVATNSTSNYNAALAKLREIGDSFNIIGQTVTAVTSTINSFTASVTSFVNGITANIFAPAQLADSIKDMFLEFDQLAPNIEDQFALAKQLFNFGGNDPVVETTTVARQQRADNQLILNSGISCNALALAYNNAANIPYSNELELSETRQSLEDEYQRLISDTNLSNTTINDLTDLRTSATLLFDDINITVPKIRNINTNSIPMSMLAYQYYGNTDNTDALIELNSTIDVSFVEREVQILTP